jgi:hypothetical protein
MKSFWRWDLADEGYFDTPQTIEAPDWYSQEDVAEAAAEVYHGDNDGWEDKWPITFRIYPPDSDEFTLILVEREYEPTFMAQYSRTGLDK